jgi:hypothetical protein
MSVTYDMKNVSKTGYWIIAMVLAVLLLGLQIGIDQLELRYGVHGIAVYFDEALIALTFSGLVVYLLRRIRVERERQIRAIRAMNHHVRNALQSILYADHLTGGDRQRKYITESVVRIERAVWDISHGVDHEEVGRELTRMNAN